MFCLIYLFNFRQLVISCFYTMESGNPDSPRDTGMFADVDLEDDDTPMFSQVCK